MNSTFTIVLDVPFRDSDHVRSLGAYWDDSNKTWCIDGPAQLAATQFSGWSPKLYLNVPSAERNMAKADGAKYDNKRRQWYIDHHLIPYARGIQTWIPSHPSKASKSTTSKATKKAPSNSKTKATKSTAKATSKSKSQV